MAKRKSDGDDDAQGKQPGESGEPITPRAFPNRPRRPDVDNRLRQADRLARVMRVLERIRGRARWNLRDIAEEEECSEQTIRRVLNVLELAGVCWYYDHEGECYRLERDPRFPVLGLDPGEIVELAKAKAITDAMADAMGLQAGTGAEPTVRKLAATSSEAAELLEDAGHLVEVMGWQFSDHSGHREIIDTVQRALLRGRQVKGRYQSPYEPKPVTLSLHPYRLALVKQAWYLIARPVDAEQPLTFRVPRFQTLRLLDAAAEIPADFDLRHYFGDAWSVYRGDRSYRVVLQFSKEAANLVTETRWHQTQEKPQRNPDGSVTVTFNKIDGLNEILRWVLGWVGRVKVIEPQELREMVVKQLQAGLDMNSKE